MAKTESQNWIQKSVCFGISTAAGASSEVKFPAAEAVGRAREVEVRDMVGCWMAKAIAAREGVIE